jgi:hypothetical protein
MVLTERQQIAQALMHEIHRMGAAVVNPMPLADGAKLRFQVLNDHRQAILEKLSSWGWFPAMCSTGPRFMPNGTAPLASIHEIDLPADRSPVVDDRQMIPGELAEREKKTSVEIEGILKYLGRK